MEATVYLLMPSQKKQHNLETCARLLLMLLQDSTGCTKMFFTEECSTLFVPPQIK